jgi:hypothetical protein
VQQARDPLNRVDPTGLAPWDSLGGLFDDDFWCDLAGWGSQVSRFAGFAAIGLAATAFFVATPAGLVVAVGLVATAGSGAQLLGVPVSGGEINLSYGVTAISGLSFVPVDASGRILRLRLTSERGHVVSVGRSVAVAGWMGPRLTSAEHIGEAPRRSTEPHQPVRGGVRPNP